MSFRVLCKYYFNSDLDSADFLKLKNCQIVHKSTNVATSALSNDTVHVVETLDY